MMPLRVCLRRAVTPSLIFLSIACSDSTSPDPPEFLVSVTPATLDILVGETATLEVHASGGPEGADIDWSCSFPSGAVASAVGSTTGCEVTGEAEGSAILTITATRGQASAQATIPVEVALPPPATPSGLTATPGDLAILLNWEANDEGYLQHYNVHQGTLSGALVKVAEVPAGNESYAAEGLVAGTTYHFAVSAQSTSESLSEPSAEVSAVPFELFPFSGAHMVLAGAPGDYIEIPHHPELNPSAALTLEGWVRMDGVSGCAGLIGKNYQVAYWIGDCAGLIRSYARLGGSVHTGGTFPVGSWVHWAVTSDGSLRRHYLDGELMAEFTESGPPEPNTWTNTSPLRIGSDVQWDISPRAAMREFRLWNVARTQAEIQATMNGSLRSAVSGLVAVWPLETDGSDALGTHHGAMVGSPVFHGP